MMRAPLDATAERRFCECAVAAAASGGAFGSAFYAYLDAAQAGLEVRPERISYYLQGVLSARISRLEERLERASRFILATNDVAGSERSENDSKSSFPTPRCSQRTRTRPR